MEINEFELKEEILKALEEQGFKVNPHLRPPEQKKEIFKNLQKQSRQEQITIHRKFLLENFELAKSYCNNGKDIKPREIFLELREIKPDSLEDKLYKWWNFIWWSIPYQRSYGRLMKFFLWDVHHDAPFGLLGLQSPILKMSVRDNYLEIPKDNLDIWINRSMHAQRVGALPPYNELLGGKMVALALTSNEVRESYKRKYQNSITLLKNRKLDPNLLFITTTSAFGKSSLYDRLSINGEKVAIPIGFTKGSGTFHIPEPIYLKVLRYLENQGITIERGFGHGPSKKLKLLNFGFKRLKLPKFEYHNIQREFYLFPLVRNLKDVIKQNQKPNWINRPFGELADFWIKRWGIPRSMRKSDWKTFNKDKFFDTVFETLNSLI